MQKLQKVAFGYKAFLANIYHGEAPFLGIEKGLHFLASCKPFKILNLQDIV